MILSPESQKCGLDIIQALQAGADNTRDLIKHCVGKGHTAAAIANACLELEGLGVIKLEMTPAHLRKIVEESEKIATGKKRPRVPF